MLSGLPAVANDPGALLLFSIVMSRQRPPSTRRLLVWTLIFGVFVLADLALFGWLIFRSLSEREINRVILEARSEAEELAQNLAGGMEERGLDLYAAVATESETQTYIDSILSQRKIVQSVEIRDSEGRVIFVNRREETQGDPGLPGNAESGLPVQIKTFGNETPFEQVEVPVGSVGTFVIGLSRREVEQRLGVLRSDLLQQASLIGALTVSLFLFGYILMWRFLKRSRELEEKADDAERMAYIGTVASGLAHEIRSPLNSLNLNMQMLEEEFEQRGGTRAGRRLTAITRSEISRLEGLVTEFLSYARPPEPELRDVTAISLMEHTRSVLEGRLTNQGASCVVEDKTGGAMVRVDPGQLTQLLLNLVENGLYACSERAHPEVRMTVEREGDQVVLSVADNGKGMTAMDQMQMFEAFYSKRKGGIGLGLAIVDRIARSHDGRLRVSSLIDQGTRIDLLLAAVDGPPSRTKKLVGETGRFLRPFMAEEGS
jgi:signal transduction histidine kinase